jgi:hypothetical protein
MRYLAVLAFFLLAACGSEHTTVIAEPGSTVVTPHGAKVIVPDNGSDSHR